MDRKNSKEFPQELFNLFDRYVHGDMDRRAFLDSMKKFAVSGLTVASPLGKPAAKLCMGDPGFKR